MFFNIIPPPWPSDQNVYFGAQYRGFETVSQDRQHVYTTKVLIVVRRPFDVIDSIRFRYYIGYLYRILRVPRIPSVFGTRHFIFSVFHTPLFPPTRIPFKLNDAHESLLTRYSSIIHFSDYIFPDVHSTSRSHNVISIAIYFVYNARFPN